MMTRIWVGFAVSLVVAACGGDSSPEGVTDSSPVEPGPACERDSDCDTEICHPVLGECVECAEADDCPSGVCQPETNTCERCASNEDCSSPNASRCDLERGTCEPCEVHADCHLEDFPTCETGRCVACGSELVALGRRSTCEVRSDGSLWCWGDGEWGQLGQGEIGVEAPSPTRVGSSNDWTQISLGYHHACGLREDRSLWCWGLNASGQLGIGEPVLWSASPTRVGQHADWLTVTAGPFHTCGIRANGSLWCWGASESGQLGLGEPGDAELEPARVGEETTWEVVVAGGLTAFGVFRGYTCGIADGSLWCWGVYPGRVSDVEPAPTRVGADADWKAIDVGGGHVCGIREDDSLWCWGANNHGQLGRDGEASEPGPVEGDDWDGVAVGDDHTCGLAQGSLWCWGLSGSGRLGLGTTSGSVPEPTRVGQHADWTAIALGGRHSCGLRREDSALWCWGDNSDHQLGLGTSGESLSSEPIVVSTCSGSPRSR